MHGTATLPTKPKRNVDIPISYPSGYHWFVVYTNIRSELRAQLGLDAKGFRTFCPMIKKWANHARLRMLVERPLLSRYFFVEIEPNLDGFGDVYNTDGVECLIGNGAPMPIPGKFVEEFIRRQLEGEFDESGKEILGAGRKVRIVGGEYDDFFGVIQKAKARSGMLLVKLMESRILTRLSILNIRPA